MKKPSKMPSNMHIKTAMVAVILSLIAFGAAFTLSHASKNGLTKATNCEQNVTCVALKADHAEPDAITVPVGGYAQFNSADNQIHSLASGTGDEHHDGSHVHTGGHLSGDFKADEGWKVQFNDTGVFEFHDHYHPEIHFTVIVYKPGGDYRIK